MTNFEKIKNMSVEEMADKMLNIVDCICGLEYECTNCPLNDTRLNLPCSYTSLKMWLESEVEE